MEPHSISNHIELKNPTELKPEPRFTLKLQHPKCLKKVLSAIGSVGSHANDTAVMEVSESGVIVRVAHVHPAHDVLTWLKMNPTSFQDYDCQWSCRVGLNFRELSGMINSARDDEAIYIYVEESFNNALHFTFVNQNGDECRSESMDATNQVNMDMPDETLSIHEFKVCIKTADFAHILEHARLNKETIQITMTSTMVTMISGCETLVLREEYCECLIEDAPTNMRHELWLSLNHINTFLLGCSLLTASVWIHDSHSRTHAPPFLEFPLPDLGNLLVYLPFPFLARPVEMSPPVTIHRGSYKENEMQDTSV